MSDVPQPAAQNQIVTVCSVIPVPTSGVIDAHNHTWIEPVSGAAPGPLLDEYELIAADLKDYARAGGVGIIDCQPGGCGRNSLVERRLSEASGVFIVAATGYHLPKYYPPWAALWKMNADQACRYFVDELQLGTEESRSLEQPVRAGFIKIACQEHLEDSPAALLEGAAAAAYETNCAIEVHTEKGAAMEQIAAYFDKKGVALQRLILCHVDKRADYGLHRDLAQAGVLLEYDTFYRPKYHPDEALWPLLKKMLSTGYGQGVALATDMAEAESWKSLGGGPGLAALAEDIRPRLAAMGVTPEVIADVTGLNIAHRIARPI